MEKEVVVEKEVEAETKALTSNVLTKEETKVLPDELQEHLDTTGSHVAFMPNDGPQTDFLAAAEKDDFMVEQQVVVKALQCLSTH